MKSSRFSLVLEKSLGQGRGLWRCVWKMQNFLTQSVSFSLEAATQGYSWLGPAQKRPVDADMLWCQWIPGLLIHIYFGAAGVTDQKQKHMLWQSAPPLPPSLGPAGSGSKSPSRVSPPVMEAENLHTFSLIWRWSTWNRSSCESKLTYPPDSRPARAVQVFINPHPGPGAACCDLHSPRHTRAIKHTLKFLLTFRIFCNVLDNSASARFHVKNCIYNNRIFNIYLFVFYSLEGILIRSYNNAGMETTFFPCPDCYDWLSFSQQLKPWTSALHLYFDFAAS